MTPSTIFVLLWLADWLIMSAAAVLIIKHTPGNDSWLWDLEDQLPLLIAVLLVAWPVLLARLLWVAVPLAWRAIRSGNSSGTA